MQMSSRRFLYGAVEAPAAVEPRVPEELNDIALRALSRDAADRFPTARHMARAITRSVRRASASEVGDWVESMAGDTLRSRAEIIATIDRSEAAVIGPAPGTEGSAVATTPNLPAAPSRASRGGRRRIVLALTLALLAASGAVVALSTNEPLRAQNPPPAVPDPLPSAASITPPDEPTPPSATTARAPPQSSASAPAGLPRPAGNGPARAPAVQPQRMSSSTPGPRRAATPAPAGCDPPYTIDSEGTRHYKLQCL